jgi:hypothetical protein
MNNKIITLDIPIKRNNYYHFSDFNNSTQYIFLLNIYGKKNISFKKIEDNKYSHIITLDDKIKLNNIESYKLSVYVSNNNIDTKFELEGDINHEQTSSTERNNNLYIEFSQNENGDALCTCFYTGLDYNKLFVSPPN